VIGAARLKCGEPAAEAGELIWRQVGHSFGDFFNFHVAQYSTGAQAWLSDGIAGFGLRLRRLSAPVGWTGWGFFIGPSILSVRQSVRRANRQIAKLLIYLVGVGGQRGAPRIRPKIRRGPLCICWGPAGSRTTGKCEPHIAKYDRRNYWPLLTYRRRRERASLTRAAVRYDQTSGSPVDDPRLGAGNPSGARCVPFCVCSRFVRVLRDCDIDPKANG
jgi:hypothetical protein